MAVNRWTFSFRRNRPVIRRSILLMLVLLGRILNLIKRFILKGTWQTLIVVIRVNPKLKFILRFRVHFLFLRVWLTLTVFKIITFLKFGLLIVPRVIASLSLLVMVRILFSRVMRRTRLRLRRLRRVMILLPVRLIILLVKRLLFPTGRFVFAFKLLGKTLLTLKLPIMILKFLILVKLKFLLRGRSILPLLLIKFRLSRAGYLSPIRRWGRRIFLSTITRLWVKIRLRQIPVLMTKPRLFRSELGSGP